MKKHLTVYSLVAPMLFLGGSTLLHPFGAKPTPQVAISTPSKPPKIEANAADTVVAPKTPQKKLERLEEGELQQEGVQDKTPADTTNDYKTAYWIGPLPEQLKDSLHTDGLVFIDSTSFDKALSTHVQEVYIHADGVPNIAQFVNSLVFQSIVQNKIRVVIYNNRTNNKDEQLVLALGGINTLDADFIMIVYREHGRSIVPIGHKENWYKPQRLSVFQASRFALQGLDNEHQPNARTAATPCSNRPELWRGGVYATNRLPIAYEQSRTNKKLFYARGTKVCEKFWTDRIYNLTKSNLIERGQQRTQMPAGSGAQTHREGYTRCTTAIVSKTWGWGLSRTFGYTASFELAANLKASFSTKITGSYTQTQSDGYSSSVCVGEGQTFYSNPCAYACCDSEGSIDVFQDQYSIRTVVIGDTWIQYTHYKLKGKAKLYKLKKPVILRYKFSRKSPYHSLYNETSEMYTSFEIRKVDKKCNATSCYIYKSNQCNESVK